MQLSIKNYHACLALINFQGKDNFDPVGVFSFLFNHQNNGGIGYI